MAINKKLRRRGAVRIIAADNINSIPEKPGTLAIVGDGLYLYGDSGLIGFGDGTPIPRPDYLSGAVGTDGMSVELNLSVPVTSIFGGEGFAVFVDGESRAFESAVLDGETDQIITFTLASVVYEDQKVSVSYDSKASIVQSQAGLMLKSFSRLVTNNSEVPVPVAPTLMSAILAANGTALTAAFSENLVSSNPALGFTVSADATPVSISAATIVSGDIQFTVATINEDQVVTLSYNAATGDIESDAGLELASFSAESVTNNSTQGGGGPIACAHPLNAPALEVQALGATGRLTLSNGDQTGSHVVPAPSGSGPVYMAFPTGLLESTAAAIDLSADTGIKVVEFAVSIPAAEATSPGPGVTYAYSANVTLVSPDFSKNISVNFMAGNVGGLFKARFDNEAGDNTDIDGLSSVSTAALIFDTGAGTVSAVLGGTPVVLVGGTFIPGSYVPLMSVGYTAARDAADEGKAISITLITDAASMTGTYSTGATDPCGNVI